jgi:hypothetical protein
VTVSDDINPAIGLTVCVSGVATIKRSRVLTVFDVRRDKPRGPKVFTYSIQPSDAVSTATPGPMVVDNVAFFI